MKKRYDKPIPFGWYAVEYSSELKPGDVKALEYFGRELVLFRSEEGEASLLNAYCPHLGAHLGHGGIVKGNALSCPFHAWEFNGEGYCTAVPYAKRIPPKVEGKQAIFSYPVVERNQMIWAWYHPEGLEPLFEIYDIPELSSTDWSELDTYDWEINTIIQETGENAADLAHFITVHGSPAMPEGDVSMDGPRRVTEFDSKAHVIDEQGNVDLSGDNHESIHLVSEGIGPGFTMQRFSRMFDVVLMGTITPIDDQRVHLRFNFTVPREQSEGNAMMATGTVQEIVRQVEQDIPIWEHKVYLPDPALCDGDGPIAKYRKWFQQFYAA
ncbi:aromatic ring-hydroxylating dioxygenase subunit alpha [Parahaliea sp. F7430]|uniref:cholesterol 7-desaturase n=1 Tax=Sediminihaliea albiluteola TaxID=2758564 RepID=A0A7W2YKK7_9GAMM|nr:Rieske 2Fe-2S domain-containing protein [Sediminihaliea albiluteola]MBA6414202.1 aromatic ring-hydroxylating dioxygenase subunit alpha [Sediminihaliea albiluteola]